MLHSNHTKRVSDLMAECLSDDLSVSKWWDIGSQMHTITDDYKILTDRYDYNTAKPELDAMWDAWNKSDPRKCEANK